MTVEATSNRGRAAALRRAVSLALAVIALVFAQLAVPGLGVLQHARAAGSQDMHASKTGYASIRDATFTYVRDDLSLEKAKFATDSPKAIAFTADGKYIARDRGASKVERRRGCVYLLGDSGTGKHKVGGSFTLRWNKAASDSFGKRYDLEMTVSDIEYSNPSGISFKDGIALMNGPSEARYDIDSKEETSPEPTGDGGRTRRNRRLRTVSGQFVKNARKTASPSAQTQVCGWVCGRENIVKMHEAFYTGVREGDTWDGKTWKNGKATKTADKSPGAGWTRAWKATEAWQPREIARKGDTWTVKPGGEVSASKDDMMVGVSMKITTRIVMAGTSTPVSGGTVGTAFRDIDQRALGKADDAENAYSGSYVEGIRFEKGFSGSVVYVDEDTTLQTGTGRALGSLSGTETFSTVKGTRATGGDGADDRDTRRSGFTCKGNAQGFSYTWEGSLCATSLFGTTNLGPTALDVCFKGTKRVDGHKPGKARFVFWLYRDRPGDAGGRTPVRVWSDGNEKLDADGREVEGSGDRAGSGKPHAAVSAENDDAGKLELHMNYWTLLHALGYPSRSHLTDDLTSEQRAQSPGYEKLGDEGLFGAGDAGHAGWYRFALVEQEDLGDFAGGDYVMERGESTVWVHLAPDGKGGAKVQVAYGDWGEESEPSEGRAGASFANLEKARVSIAVNKRLVNDSPLASPDIAGAYVFELIPSSTSAVGLRAGDLPLPASSLVRNPDRDGGLALFGSLEFAVPGEYSYRIVEHRACDYYQQAAGGGNAGPDLTFVDDDPLAQEGKSVTVRVWLGKDGHKHAEVEAAEKSWAYKSPAGEAGVEFSNVYAPPSLELPVKKTLKLGEGAKAPDVKGAYTFTLTGSPGSPMPQDGKATAKNPDSDGGTATFGKIWYDRPGTYAYAVSEEGSVDGVYNDETSSKGVSVVVADSGEVTVNGGAGVGFENLVPAPAAVELGCRKNLVCDVPGARFPDVTGRFSFSIARESATGPMPERREVSNPDARGGTASFGSMTFDRAGSYRYRVTERGAVEGFENDPRAEEGKEIVFDVAFDRAANRYVVKDGSGAPVSEATLDFDNVYYPTVTMPLAGGDFLWAVASSVGIVVASAGALLLVCRRKRSS